MTILHTGTIAPTGTDSVTLDFTSLLDHVRESQRVGHGWRPKHRSNEPHPLLVAVVALGGLMIVVAFWGLIFALIVMLYL